MLGHIDHCYISIAGHAIDIISMVGIYYCCVDKEPWWALAVTPLIAVPWFLIKVLLDRRKQECPEAEEGENSQPPPPTLKWLNNLIEILWKTNRSFANRVFKEKVWPLIEEEACNNSRIACALVGLKEFDIGGHPPRILNITISKTKRWVRGPRWSAAKGVGRVTDQEIILHIEVTFKSNASISLDWFPIPVTIRDIEASNVKLGISLKRLIPDPPFIGGLEIFLLEEPDITWETGGMAAVTDIPGIEQLVDYLIEEKIRSKLVLPNRISVKLD